MKAEVTQAVRCAVVGGGAFGKLHALTLLRLGEAHLAGIVGRTEQTLAKLPPQLAHVPCWTDMEKALRECDAQLWIVSTPTDTHRMLGEMLLKAGKAVLMEKPLASDVAQAKELAPLIRPDSSNFMVGHVALFGSEYRQLVNEAHQRGPITFMEAVRHRPTATLEHYRGDTPLNLTMVHDLYLADVLMGGVEPQRMQARFHRNAQGEVDLVTAQIDWPSGATGLFTASFLTPPGMAADGFDRLEVFGAGWAAALHGNPRPLTVWSDRAEWPLGLDLLADGAHASGILAEELRHCCRVVRGLEPVTPGVRFDDALRMQRWIECLQSQANE